MNAHGGIPAAVRTDLAVLSLSGSTIEDRGDHLIVRTSANPSFHWGNFVFVLDADRVDDAAAWLTVFTTAFPDAGHRAVGLVREPTPDGVVAWSDAGLEIEHEDALSTAVLPPLRPLPAGYTVRELASEDDWTQSLDLALAVDERQPEFERRRRDARRTLVRTGRAVFLGAFTEGRLAAELGVVDCGHGIARYQHVLTASAHRRRGLTSHLLGVAARWAAGRGCRRWVILADADSDASRLYRACGFVDAHRLTQAYRSA